MLDLLHPEVEWRAPESLPWRGTYRGHNVFREFVANVMAYPAEFRPQLLEYLDAGQRVVVLLRLIGRRKGGDTGFDVPEVHVFTLRDGRIASLEEYFDTSTVLRGLQLQPQA